MFCALSVKLSSHFWKKMHLTANRPKKELKNGMEIYIGQVVLELLIKIKF